MSSAIHKNSVKGALMYTTQHDCCRSAELVQLTGQACNKEGESLWHRMLKGVSDLETGDKEDASDKDATLVFCNRG